MLLSKISLPGSMVWIDNLYISKRLLRWTMTLISSPVYIGGVCRTGNRGFPKKITMAEETNPRKA